MLALGITLSFLLQSAWGQEIRTNEVTFSNPPTWVTSARVDRVVEKIQDILEWDIRRVSVTWYYDESSFEKLHGFGPTVLAFSLKAQNTVAIGPRVTTENFDGVFGHELVHIIVYQKYKDAIPKWLEEGLANYAARRGEVDYRWLARQPFREVHAMVHPFTQVGYDPTYHYQASRALVEMIASKCSLDELLQLSVGKNLENYLSTFCGIDDINESFKKWVKSKV